MNSDQLTPIFILINGGSGAGRGARLAEKLQGGDLDRLTAELIRWPEIDDQIARAKSASAVVLAGGDGTFSALLPRFIGWPGKLGLIPLGTGNDLVRAMRRGRSLSLREQDCLPTLVASEGLPLTVWEIRDPDTGLHLEYFVNYFSLGFSAAVVEKFVKARETRQTACKLWQRARYAQIGLCNLTSRAAPGIEVRLIEPPGGLVKAGNPSCIIFSNISSYLGCARIQASDPSDFDLELTFTKTPIANLRAIAADYLPILTLPSAGLGRRWEISGIPVPTAANRDGELFRIGCPRIEITPAGQVKISAVILP